MARKSQAQDYRRCLYCGRNGSWSDGNELMGVKIRKRGGKWYVFVNYHGRRKAKCVGASRELAEQVRRQLEAKLALGDLGFLQESEEVTFGKYADRWLKQHAEFHCKPSTV